MYRMIKDMTQVFGMANIHPEDIDELLNFG